MPTVGELIVTCDAQIDDTYDNAQYYRWFQEALDDIAQIIFLPRRRVLARHAEGHFVLPEDFKTVINVQADNMILPKVGIGSASGTGYYIMGDRLFPTNIISSTLTLFYDGTPERLVKSPTYTPTINQRWHPLLVLYACKQAMLLEDEVAYEDRYRAYLTEYITLKKSLEQFSNTERGNSLMTGATAWVVIR